MSILKLFKIIKMIKLNKERWFIHVLLAQLLQLILKDKLETSIILIYNRISYWIMTKIKLIQLIILNLVLNSIELSLYLLWWKIAVIIALKKKKCFSLLNKTINIKIDQILNILKYTMLKYTHLNYNNCEYQ